LIDLRLGDCLELLPTIESESIDAVIADIPYGTTACSWDTVIPFAPMWEQLKRVCNGAIVLTASQPFSSLLVASNIKMFKHEWIWKKDRGSNFANTVREPMKEHEHVLVFSRNGYTYNKQMQERKASGLARVKYDFQIGAAQSSDVYRQFKGEGRRHWQTLRVPSSIQEIGRETGLHPTQKPVALMEYLIRTYTNEGDTVLDFTMGSGTTGVAAVNTGRKFIGMELREDYFAIAQRRIAEAQQQIALPMGM
jgi:site-specific DNA-methyltransferase (adenine-specific)